MAIYLEAYLRAIEPSVPPILDAPDNAERLEGADRWVPEGFQQDFQHHSKQVPAGKNSKTSTKTKGTRSDTSSSAQTTVKTSINRRQGANMFQSSISSPQEFGRENEFLEFPFGIEDSPSLVSSARSRASVPVQAVGRQQKAGTVGGRSVRSEVPVPRSSGPLTSQKSSSSFRFSETDGDELELDNPALIVPQRPVSVRPFPYSRSTLSNSVSLTGGPRNAAPELADVLSVTSNSQSNSRNRTDRQQKSGPRRQTSFDD